MKFADRRMGRPMRVAIGIGGARRSASAFAAIAAMITLAGCGGGGVEAVQTPVSRQLPNSDYSGPAPATADVQAFKINLWDNVRADNRCGGCHGAGGQVPTFARVDDVNLAYEAANTVVTLNSPAESRIVAKVGGGHNCWLSSDGACGDIMTAWITAWAGEMAGTGGTEIQLKAPVLRDPGQSRSFPASSGLFGSTVHPVLLTYCSNCHRSSAANAQSPFFAEADVDAAYEAVKPKIDLDNPSNSRLVVRLRDEFHNCWSDCASDAAEMQASIEAFVAQIVPTAVDPTLLFSKALSLPDGIIASGGNRFDSNAIALFQFKTGLGNTAFDTSGVDPALDLTISGDFDWVGGWGINIRSGKAQASTTASKKLHDLIKSTGEYTIEAWVVPANVSQEEARIISYSAGTAARNFTLGQTLYNYDLFNRSDMTDGNGSPALSTADADEDLQATLQHVVATYDPVNGRRLYVNGVFTDDMDSVAGGSLADWDDTFAFVLGNEVSGDRQFQGIFKLVAIHNRVLSDAQIQQNFDAGVGEKFYLLFSVSHLINVPEAYILFEVSQFDSYGYLFNTPIFISLDPAAQADGIPLKGMRIGINGAETSVGQAYATLDTTISSAQYTPSGQPLSDIGTVIALQKGPDSDEFFLTFEVLGTNTNVRTDAVPLAPTPVDGVPASDIGLRTFEEINATMSVVTGVSAQQPDVKATFQIIKQQLPTVEDIEGFLSAHQVAVAQLSIEYCNALVDDATARASYFPGFNFNAAAGSAFDATGRARVIDPLMARVLVTGLASQPDPTAVRSELDSLITRLTACGGSCPAGRTETVVKAVCAGVVGSAAMLVQ